MKRLRLILLSTLVLSLPLASAVSEEAGGFLVIVHPDNPARSVSKKQVSRLLLKEISKWDSGLPVRPVDLSGGSATREAFSREVHGRSVTSIKSYWQRQIFSGDAIPPPELANEDEVVDFVQTTPGAIGYVSSGTSIGGVKVVAVTD